MPSDPIYFASDSHRPPPLEFQGAITNLAQIHRNRAALLLLMATAMKEAQVFDFGVMHDNRLVSESFRGVELYAKDFLKMPFRAVVYWYNVELDKQRMFNGAVDAALTREFGDRALAQERALRRSTGVPTQRYVTLAIDLDAYGVVGHHQILACDFIDTASDPLIHQSLPDSRPNARKYFLLANLGIFSIIGGEHKWWGDLYHPTGMPLEIQAHALGGLGDGVIGLSMMLATRGIPLQVERVSPKLNAKRARSGKSALVDVTHVDTRTYYEAIDNTARGGTHARPVPHLRRGHIRSYTSEAARAKFPKMAGKERWIRDSIVNCRSIEEIKQRDHYEVET